MIPRMSEAVELRREYPIESLSHRLASRVPATRIILMSSYGPDDLGDLVTATPAAGFLSKDELRAATIARVLG